MIGYKPRLLNNLRDAHNFCKFGLCADTMELSTQTEQWIST